MFLRNEKPIKLNYSPRLVMAVVCEFLCFLSNKYGKTPEANLKSLLIDFYEESEIMTAKEILHAELEKINCAGLPRLVRRKVRVR